MIAIWKREFKSLFQSVIGWLFVAALLLFTSIYFAAYNLMYLYSSMAQTMASAIMICIIAIPILTMRVLAEERKQKIDQLILTAPISVGKIVMGKYLALLSAFTIPMLVVCTYPLILSAFGDVPMGENYSSIAGFYLFGAACIAVGVFISSITENQVIAAVLSFGILLLFYLMSGIKTLISSQGNLFTEILSQFDFYEKFISFLQGTFSVTNTIYFISVICLFLFLTVQSIQKRRFSVSKNTFSTGVYSSTMIVAVLVLVILVNMIAQSLPEKYASIDVTAEKLYSISDDTKELVSNLSEDITIYVINSKDNRDDTVDRTLEGYKDLSSHIKVEYKDPAKYPNFYAQYTSDSITTNSLIVVSDKRSKVIDYNSLYETEIDYTTYTQTATGYDAEGQITSAISFVTSDNLPKVYVIEGHDEEALDSTFTATLAKENIETESINLLQYDAVPEDAQAIMILSPHSDFAKDDADKVIDYLSKGGKAFITTGVTDKDMTNFKSILEYYNVTVLDGMVVENDTNHYYGNPFYVFPDVAYDTLTDGIYGNKLIFAPYAQGLTLSEGEDISFTELLTTTDKSFNKADTANMQDFAQEEGDAQGPFTLGLLATKQLDDNVSVAAIFSSEVMFTQSINSYTSDGNLQLFTNVWSSLVEHESTVSIPVKSLQSSTLTVTQGSFIWLALLTVVVIPVTLLVTGIVIWVKRRRR